MSVTLPHEATEVTCSACGARTYVNPDYQSTVDQFSGKTNVWLLCAEECGWTGSLFSWQVTYDEYKRVHGYVPRDLLLPGDARLIPPAPEQRTLPSGPWGITKVPSSPIPDEAWSIPCPNQVGRWPRKRQCGGILIPDPADGVFFYTEFTSSVTLGFRCDVCRRPVLEHLTWKLTPEQHYAVFNRTVEDYRPEYDSDDPDDFEVQYSIWRTADRWGLEHFASLDQLISDESYDLRSIGPGEFTIKHWPSGTVWDVPDFVAQHAQLVSAEYDHDDEYDDE
jgi:hypothetical protein